MPTRAFAENARVAGYVDAQALAAQRIKAVQDIEGEFPAPDHRPLHRDAAPADSVAGPDARPKPATSLDYSLTDSAQIMQHAASQAERGAYRRPDRILLGVNTTTPLQGKAVLQGVGLYLMPCLYALLGAFVAVFRNISRKSEAALLDRADHDKAAQTLTLGVVFGAVIGLIADMLRAGGTPPPAGGGTTITLGVSALALLAGYSVGHVFGLLDDISERVFGRANGTADGGPR